MYQCFVEYRIDPKHQQQYRLEMERRLAEDGQLSLFEGTDQPGLFVEVRKCATLEEAELWKEERCGGRSSWQLIYDYMPDDRRKVGAWVFRAVEPLS